MSAPAITPPAGDRRIPPHNIDAERSVLGAVMLRPEALVQCADIAPGDFYDPKHREVFTAMRALRDRAVAIDPVTLEEQILRHGKLDALGGIAFLSELVSVVPTSDNVRFYVEIVAAAARARRIILTASEIAAKGFADYGEIDEYAAEAMRAIAGAARGNRRDNSRRIGVIAREVVDDFGKRIDDLNHGIEAQADRMPTGLLPLDHALAGGWPTGVMSILAGRPGHGKSSLARQSAIATAETGAGVHVISPEDVQGAYGQRVVSDLGDLSLTTLRTGKVLDHGAEYIAGRSEMERAMQGAVRAKDLPILVDDRAAPSVAQIAAAVAEHKERLGTKLVIVDYLQLLSAPEVGPRATKPERVAAISGALARLAREENVALVALSQLSRDGEKDERRPRNSDLRWAGEIEQDARVIVFVWQPEKSGQKGGPEVLVTKQNHGSSNHKIAVEFDGPTTRFVEAKEPYGR